MARAIASAPHRHTAVSSAGRRAGSNQEADEVAAVTALSARKTRLTALRCRCAQPAADTRMKARRAEG